MPIDTSESHPLCFLVVWDGHRAMHVHESCFVLDKPLRAILKFQPTVVFDPKLGVPFEHQPSTAQGHFAACLDDKFTPGVDPQCASSFDSQSCPCRNFQHT